MTRPVEFSEPQFNGDGGSSLLFCNYRKRRSVGFTTTEKTQMTTSKIKTLGVALILSAAIASPVFAQGSTVRPYHARAYGQQLNGDYAPQTPEEMRNLENFGFSGRDPSRVGGENPNLTPAS
jgi:hypothetical protein